MHLLIFQINISLIMHSFLDLSHSVPLVALELIVLVLMLVLFLVNHVITYKFLLFLTNPEIILILHLNISTILSFVAESDHITVALLIFFNVLEFLWLL